MRVALFGGSFNPPHIGHELAALYALETSGADELWFVPCFKHRFLKDLESFEDRYEMCRLVAGALGPRARVSDIERRLGGESRTLVTVKAILDEQPTLDLLVVVGADLEPEIDSWYRASELRSLVRFLVIGRRGSPGARGVEMPAVSSTDVRARLARGQAVDEFLPRSVLDYVARRQLYGAPENQ